MKLGTGPHRIRGMFQKSRWVFSAACLLLLSSNSVAQVTGEVQGQTDEKFTIEDAIAVAELKLVGHLPALRGSVRRSSSTTAKVQSRSSQSQETADALPSMPTGSNPGTTSPDSTAFDSNSADDIGGSSISSEGALSSTTGTNEPEADESESSSPRAVSSQATTCLYTEKFCQCKQREPTDLASRCFATVEADSATGQNLCRPVDCLPDQQYVCDCGGDELCTTDRMKERTVLAVDADAPAAMEGSSPSQSFYYCHNSVVVGAVEPVDEPDSLDSFTALELRDHVTERTAAWNATHCGCTAMINIVSHVTCLDLYRAAPASAGSEADLCTVRDCKISPNEMVCDLMTGSSLCERSLVYTERYRESQGVPRPSNVDEYTSSSFGAVQRRITACHKEGGAIERPRCISSCP